MEGNVPTTSSQSVKAISTTENFKSNILTFYLNGKAAISKEMMLAPLAGCGHCLKVGTKTLNFTKGSDSLIYLESKEEILPFTIHKKDSRYFLKNLENEHYGLMRFISSGSNQAEVTHTAGHILAENMNFHQDIIFLFKKKESCSLRYSVAEIINPEKPKGISEKTYDDTIVLTEHGFMLERKSE